MSEFGVLGICVFCQKPLKDPVSLTCGHDLCAACVDEAYLFSEVISSFKNLNKSDEDEKETEILLGCPLCGSKTRRADVKPNLVLRAIASCQSQIAAAPGNKLSCGFCEKPATKLCVFCGPLCDEHSNFLHVKGPMRSHELKQIEPGKKVELDVMQDSKSKDVSFQHMPICFEHKRRCEIVCQTCNVLVCTHCVFVGAHKGHTCIGIKELFNSMAPSMVKLAKEIREAAPSCKELLEGFECLEKKAEKEHKEVEEEVNKAFEEFHKRMEEKREQVLKDLNKFYGEFEGTVGQRKSALKTLLTKCEGFLGDTTADSLPSNAIARYTLFHMMCDLKDALSVVVSTKPPDENSKISRVVFSKEIHDPSFSPARAVQMFRLGAGKHQICDINIENLEESHSFSSPINALASSTHDGSAFYDPKRNIIVAVGGNVNNCRDVLVTRLTDPTHGATERHDNIIPFSSHGQYPIFDGDKYAYFCESEGDEDVRFGRLDLDSFLFEELAPIDNSFREFNSGCCLNGLIYVIDGGGDLCEYNPASNTWRETGMNFEHDCRLLPDPLGEGVFYALYSGTRGLFEVDVANNRQTMVTNTPRDFDLNQNGEALIVALPGSSRLLFTSLSDNWYAYVFEDERWIELSHWEDVSNGSAHLVVIPSGPVALYHIDEEHNWTGVNLR